MMGRGNALIYGKIALHSETATMAELMGVLERVVSNPKLGYPELKVLPSVDDLAEELEAEESVEEEEGDGESD